MKKFKFCISLVLPAILVMGIIISGCSSSGDEAASNLEAISSDAAIYGFPAVIMDMTRKVMTNVPKPASNGGSAPINQLGLARELADFTVTSVVRPNNDTLYEIAWIDIGREPWILSLPDTHGRYYVMQMLNYWTDVFASPGPRTTGTGAGNFAITGPGWSGRLPDGVQELKSSTRYIWLLGRILCNGSSDYQNVWNIEDQMKLTPLSAWGTTYVPPSNVPTDPSINMNATPVAQTLAMDALTFFSNLCQIMADNPPYPADAAAMANFAKIGVRPGADFKAYYAGLDNASQAAIVNGYKAGIAKIPTMNPSVMTNGWTLTYGAGDFGTNYDFRAVIAYAGLGANLNVDAFYPSSPVAGNQQKYSSDNKYILHFKKDQIPPVNPNAFWSLTLYNDQQLLADNSIGRYKLGSLSEPALIPNADGSLDLYIQRDAPDSPGTLKYNNWLPAPASGGFSLTLRLYWPQDAVLNKSWVPPAVQPVQ